MPHDLIVAQQLSKQYTRVKHRPSLRQDFRRLWSPKQVDYEPLMALKDVSFTLEKGQSLGIIGRNGAGKSTLMRLMAGVNQPSSGSIRVYEPFMAILSPQAGSIGVRSGRENIYLMASMHGVMPRLVDGLMDKIIAFAELEDAIDDMVDHYSSGMKARLSFSVALHIAPSIFLIDESLAVGDMPFQEKCMLALEGLQQQGHTLVLISHGMSAVERLCSRTLWLDQGQVVADGPTTAVVRKFRASVGGSGSLD